jgi:hypothetical protein
MRAAEARFRGLLVQYPETDATADMLEEFGQAYAEREESEGSRLAWATLLHTHPDGPLAERAREGLGSDPAPTGDDPMPRLIAFLDSAKGLPDRQEVPRAVSAYPDTGNASGQRY